jgi:CheY-like chemotaxis protein
LEVLEQELHEVVEAETPQEVEVPVFAPVQESSVSDVAVVVLDGNGAWERAGDTGRVIVVPPDENAPARLGEVSPAGVLVNVAAPGALAALAEFRASGGTAPAWGCLAEPGRDRGLPLGRIEPACRPLDPGALAASLRRANVPRAARVITVGDDVDAFVSLRQALTRDGMSVSMAWNAKQAADLFPMVRPAVVVLDLDLPAPDAASALALVAAADRIALTVLVTGRRDPAATLAGVPPELVTSRLGSLASVLGRSVPRRAGGA